MKDTGFCTFLRNVTMQLPLLLWEGETKGGEEHEGGQMQYPEADISLDQA